MPRIRALAAFFAIVLLGTASNQCLSRADVYSMIGSGFSWKSTPQSSWATDHTMVTWNDFVTYISNNGSCTQPGGSANGLMNYGQMTACAASAVSHTPILANNSFAGASFASWTNDAGNGCTWGAVSSPAEDGDSGSARTASPLTSSCSGGFTQTFNITGTPTSQSLTFYYQVPLSVAGDSFNCTQGQGSAAITIKVNGNVIPSPSITYDNSWHVYTVGIGLSLISGTNTIDISTTANPASGTTLTPPNNLACNTPQHSSQTVYIDNVSLTATY